jgi:hypothetical protein
MLTKAATTRINDKIQAASKLTAWLAVKIEAT